MLLFGRTCTKQVWQQSGSAFRSSRIHGTRTFTFTSRTYQRPRFFQNARQFFRHPPPPIKGGTACLAALSPAAFVTLSENEEESGKTGEQQMLEASRQELAEQVPGWLNGSKGFRRGVWKFLDTWIVEPIATGFRLLHLIFIFVPVIVTVPAIWIGKRHPDRDDERTGSLWWYAFLVNSMERAGAAFIKVRTISLTPTRKDYHADIRKAWPMGRLKNRYLSNRDVRNHVGSPL